MDFRLGERPERTRARNTASFLEVLSGEPLKSDRPESEGGGGARKAEAVKEGTGSLAAW